MAEEQGPSSILSNETIRLPHKPNATLSYGFTKGRGNLGDTHLLVFLSGLLGTQSGWHETVERLTKSWEDDGNNNRPALLTYDRYGQGQSARDPYDETNEFGHDLHEVVQDLKALASEVWKLKIPSPQSPSRSSTKHEPKLIFVANSVGCVIGRFFAQVYPGTTSALLFLDSNIANSDQVSLFPDPDARDFDPDSLPADVTIDDLRQARKHYHDMFSPDMPNPENFNRSNIPDLLPHADSPALKGSEPGGCGPWITVVGHDWDKFAEDGADGSLSCPKSLTNAYVNPAWGRYNTGLVQLTSDGRGEGPIIAENCGHFIQKDDPLLVARLTQELLAKVVDNQ